MTTELTAEDHLLEVLDEMRVPIIGPAILPTREAAAVVALPITHVKLRALRRRGYGTCAAGSGHAYVWPPDPDQETPADV